MPAGKIGVNPLRYRQDLPERAVFGAPAEPWGNQIVDHSRIECVSGKRHSFRTQDSMHLIA